MNRSKLWFVGLASIVLGAWSLGASAAHPNCTTVGGTYMKWPASGAPVWEMCWLAPNASVGPRGSGLEVRDVYYKGILVAKRMHAPVLFAEYRGGTCYRDWKDTNATFAAVPAVRNTLGVPTAFFATTTCDVSRESVTSHGNCPFNNLSPNPFSSADCMSPTGVALEDWGDHVLLTTQYSAAWYQYSSRFAFYANGDINPEFGFGNSNGTNNNLTHWHHNYWRFDFDIDGAANDQISANDVLRATEFTDLRSLTGGPGGTPTHWDVTDSVEGFGYRITSGDNDYLAPNESTRGFHTVDVLGLAYVNGEYSDMAGNNLGDCAFSAGNLANAQPIASTDVAFMYRASVRDSTANNWPTPGPEAIPQDSMICKRVGPLITQVGDWPIFRDDFD